MGRQFILNINQANICTFSPNLLTKRHNTETRLVFHLIVPTLNMVHIYMTALKRTYAMTVVHILGYGYA